MNRIIFSALLLSGVAVNAQQQQVGINTAEPKATLHVEAGASENKGVIIPRITAADNENHDHRSWGRPPCHYYLSKRNPAFGRPHR